MIGGAHRFRRDNNRALFHLMTRAIGSHPTPHECRQMTKTSMTPDIVAFNLAVTSKKQLLQSLSERVAQHGGLCERMVMDAIMKREKLGSTGIGEGIALPHATLPKLSATITLLATLESSVEFDSPDGDAVDLVALVLGNQEDSSSYLASIKTASHFLKARGNALRDADNEAAVRQLLDSRLTAAA